MRRLIGFSTLVILTFAGSIRIVCAEDADIEAIQKSAEEYVTAFNKGDFESIVALWSENGDYVDPSGKSYRGKDAIKGEMKDFFSRYPGASMKIVIDTIHVDSPGVAIEDGVSQVRYDPNGGPANTRYTVVHVKEGDRWLMQSMREGKAVAPSNHDELKGLDWMVGDWIDTGEQGETVQSSCGWSVNKNFLIRTYTTFFEEGNSTSGTQTIGWDPGSGSIKSWTFDTNGGITEGVWSKDGDKWLCKMTTVLRTGEKFSATEVLVVVDENSHTWQSLNRKIDDEALPETEVVTIYRQ